MAAAAAAAAEEESARLSELLESGWRLLEEVESDVEASSGAPAVQRRVQRGLELLERASRAMAQLELFSRNEELEEIASADLRFMLVPALLAALTLRQVAPPRRLEHLRRARGLFLDFLRLCRDYAVARFDLPRETVDDEEEHGGEAAPAQRDGQASLLAMAAARRVKIERYKQKKDVENQLASLKPFIDSGQAEEEQIREFYLLQIKKWVTISLEEIESIDQEISILSRRGALQCEQMLKIAPPPVFPSLLPGFSRTTFPAAPPSSEALHPYSGCCPGKVYHWEREGPSAASGREGGGLDGRWADREGRVDSSCSCCSAQPEESWPGSLPCRVFGAGYPSLATMTVDEWYDQHQKQGVLPEQGISQRAPGPEDQQKEQEEATEEDEQAAALKAREWDDWKDLHPRGYGNRKNMG